MSKEIIQELDRAIEEELSAQVEKLKNANCSRTFFGNFVELLYAQDFAAGELYSASLEIVGGRLPINCDGPVTKNISRVLREAAEFGAAYHVLRDYIYYFYANPASIACKKTKDCFLVSVKDRSFLRQVVHERQVFAMNSLERLKGKLDKLDSKALAGTKHWDIDNPIVVEQLDLIQAEVGIKVDSYFSYIPNDSKIEMGGFCYADLLKVYKELLFLSLYERRFASANKIPAVIHYTMQEIRDGISHGTGVTPVACELALKCIAAASQESFIWDQSQGTFHLLPNTFSLRDGLGATLRMYATKHSKRFLADFAGPIGSALVERIDAHFLIHKNFRTRTEIKLQSFNKDLPDIDCLAVSYEPSLGFHAYICEAKNNLPAKWAKDFLKGSGEGGYLEKALNQIEKLKAFLSTQEGAIYLRALAEKMFAHLDLKSLFPTGFVILVDYIVVTSQNIGVSYPDEKTTIVDADLLQHIIENSDGDVNYMQATLRKWHETVDQSYRLSRMSTMASGKNIKFDVAQFKKLIKLRPNSYLSSGWLERIETESLETGYRFIDTLAMPSNDASEG
ncbi:hypothetical protein [Paraburkholderia kururiensis]|uniref:hypothetical protein n=1 Tax=Paraburkholderia kururiensis TaxID=984307 RepID=UPI0018F5F02D|nr:hypothetical protein [Paraburkholderia kururiensis]